MTRQRQDGFTLVELLVVVAVLAMVAVALSQAMFIGWRTTATAGTTFAGSHDAQITEAFFSQDVQSAAATASGILG